MKNKKKHLVIAIATLTLLACATAIHTQAQILVLDDYEYVNSQRAYTNGGMFPITPTMDVTTDQYVPLGGGTLLLGCLGGAYLLRKRRNTD